MEKYQRKNFLINKDFQIRYCVYVCSWLFTLSFVYPFIIYEVFDFFIRYVAFHSPQTQTKDLQETRTQIIWLLGALQFVFLVVTFLISVFVSHRIAGPIHKLKVWMQAGRDGRLRPDLYFRKADYFREIATEYNLLISGVYSLVDRNVAKLEELTQPGKSASKEEIAAIIEDLKTIREKIVEPSDEPSSSGSAASAHGPSL